MSYSIELLRLDGFKSFRRPTELHFSPGVSVLVGRNGSGKSNVVDALRWVLGENDLRSLRVRHPGELRSADDGSEPSAQGARVTALLTTADADRTPRVVTRWIGGANDGWTLDGRPVGTVIPQPEASGMHLRTVIRQGEVGRLLWLHPDERAQLFATALHCQVPAPDHGCVAPGAVLSELLQGRIPASDRPLFDHVVRTLDGGWPGRSIRAGTGSYWGWSESEHVSFLELHGRVEDRFARFFSMLVPGAEGALPVDRDDVVGDWRVGLRVRFPHKPQVPLSSLSGGQLATLGLCLALAFFLEVPSPALVLDEVEPALDEAMVRRLASLLRAVALERQVILVSHQRLIRETAATMFELRRRRDHGSSIWFRYDPRSVRAPGGGTRA